MQQDEIQAFLHYAFVPSPPSDLAELPWFRSYAERTSLDGLQEAGFEAFRQACRNQLGQDEAGPHIVPLSGGLDSRLVLAVLIEMGLRDSITAVTFGTPGMHDYEIGALVARGAGVRHEAIRLPEVSHGRSAVEATLAAGGRRVPVFEALYNRLIPERFGKDARYWSGLMANTLCGSQCTLEDESWSDACVRFSQSKRYARSVELTPPGYDPVAPLPGEPLVPGASLQSFEQLHAGLVYAGRYDPTVIAPGYDYRMPFRDPAWVEFALSLPRSERVGQALYHRMAKAMAPELFALPAKTTHGVAPGAPQWQQRAAQLRRKVRTRLRRHAPWILWSPNPALNYIDVDRELRVPGEFADTILEALEGLHERQAAPWLEPLALWEAHRRRRVNHGVELCLLASLEMNLRYEAAGAS